MRLAQIARKVNKKPTEIRTFINSKFKIELDSDPNIKLEDDYVNAILEEFHIEEVVEEVKTVEKPKAKAAPKKKAEKVEEVVEEEPVLVKSDDISVKTKEAEIFPKADDVKTNTQDLKEAPAKKKVVEIKYDETEGDAVKSDEEPTSFEEVEVDREAELIAARVEKLEGLKVVGKIDLGTDDPEPEEEELPTAEAIESEIDALDGDVDTSEFTELAKGEELSDEKAAIFAELDAAMDSPEDNQVKTVSNEAAEVSENVEEEEYSIYKNARGIYRWTTEQKQKRQVLMATKAEELKKKRLKKKKQLHYQENVAAKVKPPKKKNVNKPTKKQVKEQKQKEQPKGVWQKFLAWLND